METKVWHNLLKIVIEIIGVIVIIAVISGIGNCLGCGSCFGCSSCGSCDGCSSCGSCDGCSSCGSCDGCSSCGSCSACESCSQACEDCSDSCEEKFDTKYATVDGVKYKLGYQYSDGSNKWDDGATIIGFTQSVVKIPKTVKVEGTKCDVKYIDSNLDISTEITSLTEDSDYFSTYDGALYNGEMTTLYRVLENRSTKTAINLPKTVSEVYDYAFSGCSSVTTINLFNVSKIGTNAFSGCSSLTSITVGSSNESFSSSDGILYNGSKTRIVKVPNALTGFVNVASNIMQIDAYAFSGCTRLTGVNFEVTTGWKCRSEWLDSTSLASSSTALTYLTDTYKSNIWTRSATVTE